MRRDTTTSTNVKQFRENGWDEESEERGYVGTSLSELHNMWKVW